jgi:hypothetical protein
MTKSSSMCFAVTFLAATTIVLSALPPRSREDLEKTATDIVVGEVKQVYTAARENKPGFVDTLYCFEISVTKVEKGDHGKDGKVLMARAWAPAKRPSGWAGPQGQNVIPEGGKTYKFHLVEGKDGGLDAITPNGIEAPK